MQYTTYGVAVQAVVTGDAFEVDGLATGAYCVTLRSPRGVRLVLPKGRWEEIEEDLDLTAAAQ